MFSASLQRVFIWPSPELAGPRSNLDEMLFPWLYWPIPGDEIFLVLIAKT
jgi:hypothetical protein